MPKTVPLHPSPYVDGDMSAPKGILSIYLSLRVRFGWQLIRWLVPKFESCRAAGQFASEGGHSIGYLDVDVNAVQEGTGDALLVAADHGEAAGAFMYLVTTRTIDSP